LNFSGKKLFEKSFFPEPHLQKLFIWEKKNYTA